MTNIRRLDAETMSVILSFAEEDEARVRSCAGALRCTSSNLDRTLTSGAYYYAFNHLLRRKYNIGDLLRAKEEVSRSGWKGREGPSSGGNMSL